MQVTARLLQGWRILGRIEGQIRVMVLPKSISAFTVFPLSLVVNICGLASDCEWTAHPVSQDLLTQGGGLQSDLVGMGLSRCDHCSCTVLSSELSVGTRRRQ